MHGYIGFTAERPPNRGEYSAGMGFYSAVWPLIDQPLADFQIGLASSWITPDNSDNKDKPLAAETRLLKQESNLAGRGAPYTSPAGGAWTQPGPKSGPMQANLADGSRVIYAWYRFVDQPSFQQYAWSEAKKAKLQALAEKIHANWPIDRDYMALPSRGKLVSLDPALLVTPPPGMEAGYVPIVTGQSTR